MDAATVETELQEMFDTVSRYRERMVEISNFVGTKTTKRRYRYRIPGVGGDNLTIALRGLGDAEVCIGTMLNIMRNH